MTIAESFGKIADKLKRKKKPEVVFVRVEKDAAGRGVLVPADGAQAALFRKRKMKVGRVYGVQIRMIRNPGFWRKVHSLMIALAANVERLAAYQDDPHRLLKKVQLEARLHCEEIMIEGGFVCFVPLSFNFEQMDEFEFAKVYGAITAHIRSVYWPGLSDDAMEEIAAFESEQG